MSTLLFSWTPPLQLAEIVDTFNHTTRIVGPNTDPQSVPIIDQTTGEITQFFYLFWKPSSITPIVVNSLILGSNFGAGGGVSQVLNIFGLDPTTALAALAVGSLNVEIFQMNAPTTNIGPGVLTFPAGSSYTLSPGSNVNSQVQIKLTPSGITNGLMLFFFISFFGP